jgi:tetratricopeptide (TPR) repeat protein
MPDSESSELQADATAVAATGDVPGVSPPAPEPWTAERVLEWNRYYDLYVAAGVVLLVFIASIHQIVDSLVWPMIQSGRLIAKLGPLTSDPFSMTLVGKPWVNIPWLFELLCAAVYDPASRITAGASSPQIAAGALILLNAGIRAGTALLLLRLRKPGPGLWWVAVCVLIALGGMLTPTPGAVSPIVPTLGGIAMPASIEPATFGLFFLAIELLLLHRSLTLGRKGALYGLPVLFVFWANSDASFLFGLAVLLLSAIGHLVNPSRTIEPSRKVSPGLLLGVLIGSVVVCLVNPAQVHIFEAAWNSYRSALGEGGLSFFGESSRKVLIALHGGRTGAYAAYVGYYVILVAIGLLSFVLNRRRFQLGRLLVFIAASALFGAHYGMAGIFAVVLASILALNGQEWYLDKVGVHGQLGGGWTFLSVGGRALTLLIITAFMFKGLTGFGSTMAEPRFGLGVNMGDFPFEAAAAIKGMPLSGNVLNTSAAQGDAMIWRSYPVRKPFIDSRPNLYSPEFREEFAKLRTALRDDDVEAWKPFLDQYQVSAVMIPMRQLDPTDPAARNTFLTLKSSANWIPFYDDGSVVIFGRSDAPADDLAYFNEHALTPDAVAFGRDGSVPPAERTPTPPFSLDKYFPNRGSQAKIEPHVWAAARWLSDWAADPTLPPDLAQSLMAIREARTAIAHDPDDTSAWRVLNQAYRHLAAAESAILARDENLTQTPRSYRNFRLRQRATVLHYAIQTTPPPRNTEAKIELAGLNRQLADVYIALECVDLARDRLQDAYDLAPADFDDATQAILDQLDQQVEQVNTLLNEVTAEEQADPARRAEIALAQGMAGMATVELQDAQDSGTGAGVKARLFDLYCQAGEPDRAFDLFSGNINDPSLSTGPGTGFYRQGLAYFLIGSYEMAASLWRDRSIPELRAAQAVQALQAGRAYMQGDARTAADFIQEIPGRVANQANWEFELGLCLLEGGKPREAGVHLTNALTLEPAFPMRPLIAAYLEKLGMPVPEAPDSATPPERPASPTLEGIQPFGADFKPEPLKP